MASGANTFASNPYYLPGALATFRSVGDPTADQLIAPLVANGRVAELNALLGGLMDNRDVVRLRNLRGLAQLKAAVHTACSSAPLRNDVIAWIEREAAGLPPADDPRLKQASSVFMVHGPLIALLLTTASLVHAYAAPVGAHTLSLTYRLGHEPRRRIGETAQFVIATMDPRGFAAQDGMALPTILKVRLMHAAIRALIEDHLRATRGLSFGQVVYELGLTEQPNEVPLCQEDQLGALMSFSSVVLEGLGQMGVKLSLNDQEAYMYHWCFVGQALGVDPKLLPRSVAEARVAREAVWAQRAKPGNPDGVALTRVLVDMLSGESPDWFDGITIAVMRKAIGISLADGMRVPTDAFWDSLIDSQAVYDGLMRLVPRVLTWLVGDPVQEAARRFLTVRLKGSDRYVPAAFIIPDRLQDAWGTSRGATFRSVPLGGLARFHRAEARTRVTMRRLTPGMR